MKAFFLCSLAVTLFCSCFGGHQSTDSRQISPGDIPTASYKGENPGIYRVEAGEELQLTTGISSGELELAVRWKNITQAEGRYLVQGYVQAKATEEPLRDAMLVLARPVKTEETSGLRNETIAIDSVAGVGHDGEFNLCFAADGKTRLYIALVGFRTVEYCFDRAAMQW